MPRHAEVDVQNASHSSKLVVSGGLTSSPPARKPALCVYLLDDASLTYVCHAAESGSHFVRLAAVVKWHSHRVSLVLSSTSRFATSRRAQVPSRLTLDSGNGKELVFSAQLFPAIAANPYLAFHLRANKEAEGKLENILFVLKTQLSGVWQLLAKLRQAMARKKGRH